MFMSLTLNRLIQVRHVARRNFLPNFGQIYLLCQYSKVDEKRNDCIIKHTTLISLNKRQKIQKIILKLIKVEQMNKMKSFCFVVFKKVVTKHSKFLCQIHKLKIQTQKTLSNLQELLTGYNHSCCILVAVQFLDKNFFYIQNTINDIFCSDFYYD